MTNGGGAPTSAIREPTDVHAHSREVEERDRDVDLQLSGEERREHLDLGHRQGHADTRLGPAPPRIQPTAQQAGTSRRARRIDRSRRPPCWFGPGHCDLR